MFDKDDDDTLDLVTAAANLRAWVYSIARKTRFEIKEIAGNIIPAIASTNAIVAAQIVFQAIRLLQGKAAYYVHLGRTGNQILSGVPLAPPNPACPTSSENYAALSVRADSVTLGTIFDTIVTLLGFTVGNGTDGEADDDEEEIEVSVYNGTRLCSMWIGWRIDRKHWHNCTLNLRLL